MLTEDDFHRLKKTKQNPVRQEICINTNDAFPNPHHSVHLTNTQVDW